MTEFTTENLFLLIDAVFASISTLTCVLFFIRYKHPLRYLFAFLFPFFAFVAVGFWLRSFGVYELGEVADFLRPPFAVIFLAPALFYFAMKEWIK